MTDDDEKKFRTTPRIRAEVRVRLSQANGETDPQDQWATTKDVGRGGAFLRTDRAFDAGTRITLHIETAAGETLDVEAEVKWCSPPGAEDQGMGVSYVDPSPELRQQLHGLAEQGELPVFELYDD